MQRAVSSTMTMAKCLMAMASLEQSREARLVSSLRTCFAAKPRTSFRSIKRTGIEALMQRLGKRPLAEKQASCRMFMLFLRADARLHNVTSKTLDAGKASWGIS